MERQPDYYLILGVAPDASPQEIARAYRSLVRRRHPDSRPEGDQQAGLADIYDAWAVLRDPARRAEYDGATRAQERSARAGAQPAAARPVPVRVRRDGPVRPSRDPLRARANDRVPQDAPASRDDDEPAARPAARGPAQRPGQPTIWVGPTIVLGPRPGRQARRDGAPNLVELLRELRHRLL
ncbi:J domain-containing protein [Georgenia sp. EYE_87]|uniref:J domain-containing protein n=1 Tax=Georgenia sp. EYE_87 TaxID=2853448 RepID=UPI0020032F4D|nr:J domain-containing protein [Georgenia sp. EYE_87]MCK6210223.1 J domain-containing protein [Georgenia sp. EYE_87]